MSRHAEWQPTNLASIRFALEKYYEYIVEKAVMLGEETVKTMSSEMAEASGIRSHSSDPMFLYDERRLAAHALKVMVGYMDGERKCPTNKDYTVSGRVVVDYHERVGTTPIKADSLDDFEGADGVPSEQDEEEEEEVIEQDDEEEENDDEEEENEEEDEENDNGDVDYEADDAEEEEADAEEEEDDADADADKEVIEADEEKPSRKRKLDTEKA